MSNKKMEERIAANTRKLPRIEVQKEKDKEGSSSPTATHCCEVTGRWRKTDESQVAKGGA